MSVHVVIRCSGCSAGPLDIGAIKRRFRGLVHADHGFGVWETVMPEAPEGWTLFDPYTQCCYCPVCSEELWGPPVNQDAAAEVPTAFDHYAALLA